MYDKYINRLMYTNIKLSPKNSQKEMCALNVAKKADVVMLLGRAFHKVAAATTNELSPAFTCVRTTVNKLCLLLI